MVYSEEEFDGKYHFDWGTVNIDSEYEEIIIKVTDFDKLGSYNEYGDEFVIDGEEEKEAIRQIWKELESGKYTDRSDYKNMCNAVEAWALKQI